MTKKIFNEYNGKLERIIEWKDNTLTIRNEENKILCIIEDCTSFKQAIAFYQI